MGFGGPKFAKFPVKFPVSREFWRETGAISTASPATQSRLYADLPRGARKGRQLRLLHLAASLETPISPFWRGQIAESLRPFSKIFPFPGDYGRRLGSNATAG